MGSKNKNTLGLSSFVVKKREQGAANFTGSPLSDVGTYAFPDASAMSCQQLLQHINDLKYKLDTECLYSKNAECASSYADAIKTATEIYNTKGCSVKSSPIVVPDPPVKIREPFLPAFPSPAIGITNAGTPVTTNSKKAFPWLWVVIGGALLYLFTSNKSS